MDGQNNVQNNTQNTNGNQQQGTSEFTSFFIPFTFNIGQPQQGGGNNGQTPPPPQTENNPQQNGSPNGQLPQFHLFVFPMPVPSNGDGQATPNVMFFTPFLMPQQEVYKPRASESAMKNLPIVTITKEHGDAKGSCSICLDPFISSDGNEDKATSHNPVRKMPCDHMFCEPCLFQWLRQSNTCPLCRKEIEAEETQRGNGIPNSVPMFTINISTPNIPTTTTTTTTTTTATTTTATTTTAAANMTQSNSSSSHDSHSARCSNISCALASVGCCEETDNTMPTPIITLPQCHHRFHVSCLRTSLVVEGYSLDEINSMSRTLNFRCPTCRVPATIQSDILNLDSVPNERISPEGGQEQERSIFNLPLTIRMPDSDEMDLD